MAWLRDPIGTLSLTQRLLVALRAAGAALHATDTARAADAGWNLGYFLIPLGQLGLGVPLD